VPASAVGLRVRVDGGAARLTLDRPERRNAQTPALWRALAAVPAQLPSQVRTVLVDALGPSFSAGLDRRMFTPEGIPGEPTMVELGTSAENDPDALDATIAAFQDGFSWLRDPRFVSVAAVQGHAVGAGFQLALACDLRIVADDAQLSMREPSLGLVPDLGGTQPLVDCLGYARALELCATGRSMPAAEAVSTGLALWSVPTPDLSAAADALVAALGSAPAGAVRATKRLLLGASRRPYPDQLAAERAEQAGRLLELARTVPG
jgi:enoyl-CoA hydratase/carnithine racemase